MASMSWTWTLFLLVAIISMFLCGHEVQGGWSLSEEEDFALEEQLNILNKPPVKVIQDQVDGIIDCIDINKQPAFDHPLLKNHIVQMKPTSLPHGFEKKISSAYRQFNSALKRVDCPQGTVPIRRTHKEDLIRAKSFSERYYHNIHQRNTNTFGQQVAQIRTIDKQNVYFGVQSYINIQNPRVRPDQWSSAQMWFENGADKELNTIQAGWMVAPELFGDDKTRTFIYWTAPHVKGCFNTLCPGFVQVDTNYLIGTVLPNISIYGGLQQYLPLFIHQDESSKVWWLTGRSSPDKAIHFGYWNSSLFPYLNSGTPIISLGGLTKGPANGPSPPMGNGYFPNDGDFTTCSNFARIQIMDESYALLTPDSMESNVDNSKCYKVKDFGYRDENVGYIIQYGGPGGDCTM